MSDPEQEWKLVYDARCYGTDTRVNGPVSPLVVDGPLGRELWLVDYDRFRDEHWAQSRGPGLEKLYKLWRSGEVCALKVRWRGGAMGVSFHNQLLALAELFGGEV